MALNSPAGVAWLFFHSSTRGLGDGSANVHWQRCEWCPHRAAQWLRASTTNQGLSCRGCSRRRAYYAAVDGLKEGLKELGFAEGKHYVLEIRDLKGDLRAADAAAGSLEREKVDLIYTVTGSATTAVKRATTGGPIVFAVGRDPVAAGLVESFAKPGGRCRPAETPLVGVAMACPTHSPERSGIFVIRNQRNGFHLRMYQS